MNIVCKTCGEEKDCELFHKRPEVPSGRRRDCIDCMRKKSNKHYYENKEQILASINKERKKAYDLKYSKEYIKKNLSKVRAYQRKYYHEKKLIPINRLINNVRSRIRISFQVSRWNKNNKTKDILGCDYQTLFDHINSKFTEGMSWDRIGNEIHIDHIIPLSSAKTEEDVIRLNHYTNLQPLWASDNLKKGSKY